MTLLHIWDKLARPDPKYLKTIGAGRLRGKSDINPQWRYMAMTEQFGPCGVGWKFTIDKLWTEKGDGAEVFAFALVSVYIKTGPDWSEPIPGVGGHKLVESEAKGPHNNDECFKMAVTDALSTALKMLGVAAEIYLGNWDGAKYANQQPPADRSSFGGSKPVPPKFSWTTASSAERKDYVLAKIDEAVRHPDPVQGLNKIHEISSKLKGDEMANADMEKVADALLAAEKQLQKQGEI